MTENRIKSFSRTAFTLIFTLLIPLACAGAEKNNSKAQGEPTEEVSLMAGEESSSAEDLKAGVEEDQGEEPEEPPTKKVKKKKSEKSRSMMAEKSEPKAKESPEIASIKEVVKKYQTTRAVGMKVEKKVHLALMDEDKTGKGRLWYSKGRLKMTIAKPEDSLLVMNDDIIWVVSKLPEEFGGTIQVTKMKAAQLKKSNALLAVLFGDEAVWDRFELMSADSKKGRLTVELKPLKEAHLADVMKVKVQVDHKAKKIIEIAYWDELENVTLYRFSEIKFGVSLSGGHFKYKPPPGAEVTEM
ncbi:MAG: outer membrane lipoprotein carrier protein LolA [Bdellovibrionales bacterium]|nr:outer membrane lipoprotein carrier protein LolA [Bdellovibrionales bacterium]